MARYRIIDEPTPSGLATVAVKPIWPLFAAMLAGAWLAYPWFLINAFAIGSIGRGRQIAWVLGAVVGSAAITVGILAAIRSGIVADGAFAYLFTLVMLWKLWVAYVLYVGQVQSFELHEYAGGPSRNGVFLVLIGAFYLRGALTGALVADGDTDLAVILMAVLL